MNEKGTNQYSEGHQKHAGGRPRKENQWSPADKIEEYKFIGDGLSGGDRKEANRRFNNYRKIYRIKNYYDIQLLEELVYLETKHIVSKRRVDELTKKCQEALAKGEHKPRECLDIGNEEELMIKYRKQILIYWDKVHLRDREHPNM